MKMNSFKAVAAIGLSALALSTAAAQDAASKPVGYETLNYGSGFTPLGLRLHEAPVTSGVIASADAASITVTDADFGALLTDGADYVLEIEGAKGIIQIVNTWSGDSITTPSDLSAEITAGQTTFTIRPVATLSSVFGSSSADVSLASGNGNPDGADQIWLSNGSGGYNKYYFDNFAIVGGAFVPSWVEVGVGAVDGAAVNLVYADGIVVNSPAGGSVVVTGSVKITSTELSLLSGFTFVSSVAPAGATLSSTFGDASANVALSSGNGNPDGADQVWIQNDSGSYDQYYFDNFAIVGGAFVESWTQIGAGAIDGTSVSLPAGIVINSPAGGNVTASVPSFYGSL